MRTFSGFFINLTGMKILLDYLGKNSFNFDLNAVCGGGAVSVLQAAAAARQPHQRTHGILPQSKLFQLVFAIFFFQETICEYLYNSD